MNIIYSISFTSLIARPGESFYQLVSNASGFQMAITGMLTVFIGLVVIWGMVNLNRRLVQKLENRGKKKEEKQFPDASLSPMAMAGQQNLAEIAAIIAATCAVCEEFEEDHMDTLHLQNIAHEVSPWAIVAREQMMRKR